MPRELPAGYFSSGVWARDGPLRLRRHTCVVCGARLKTWVGFQAHRRVCEAPLAPPGPALDLLDLLDPGDSEADARQTPSGARS